MSIKKKHRTRQDYSANAAFKFKEYYLFFMLLINSAGNNMRLVKVATTRVREVSQPSDCVLPKPLKQKIINPADNTIDV